MIRFLLLITVLYYVILINDDIKLEYLKNNSNKYEIQWTEKFKLDDKLNYKNGNLVYISADRIGARDLYEQNQNPLDKIGIYGEYAISYFENNKREKIENYLIKNKNTPTLEDNLNFWLEEILNTHLETEPIKGTDYIKASFAYLVDKNRKPKFVKPKNIGTGTSFLIAILIACLSAKEGNIIIIENPEIHLHPKAQSKLGKFFAFIANGGVQLIIETHNDHIINRISYEEYSKKLKKDEVVIYYKGDAIEPFEKIEIQNGQFLDIRGNNQFPEGFFDATLQEIFEING